MPTEPRPIGVTITTLLMALCLVAELIEQFKYFYSLRSPYSNAWDLRGLSLVAGYLLLYKVNAAFALSFYWRGRDWALWLVMIEAAFTLTGLSRTKSIDFTPQPLTTLICFESALALFLLYYLNLRRTRAWFR